MSLYCYHCMNKIVEEDKPCPFCGKNNSFVTPVHHLLPGTILNQKFIVGKALGEGGFGITYIGRDINLDIRIAVKEFFPNGFVSRNNTASQSIVDSISADRKDFFIKGRERFLTESRILARFSDEPGIVEVRDFFEENNTAYIVMEYLDGCNLKTYVKNNGLMSPEQALHFLVPVMKSLKRIHEHGLIHRDISPDNIMYTGKAVKLLDFGAARSVSAEANKSLSVMLKPGFTPEEQYRSKGVQGPWTDIYALCATMYKLITGITPEDATQRIFGDDIKRPSQLGIIIPPNVENAIMKGMSILQKDRFQTIDEMLEALSINVSQTEERKKEPQAANSPYPSEYNAADRGNGKNTENNEETLAAFPSRTESLTVLNASGARYNATTNTFAADNCVPTENNCTENSLDQKKETLVKKKTSLRKIFIAILIALSLVCGVAGAVLLFGDSNAQDSDDNSSDAKSTDISENYTDSISENHDISVSTSNDSEEELSAFDCSVFYIGGKQYSLPCTAKEFIDDGWEPHCIGYGIGEDDEYEAVYEPQDVECNGLSSFSTYLKKNDEIIYVEGVNRMSLKRDFVDCDIVYVCAESDEAVSFSVDRSINICDSKETITSMLPEMKSVASHYFDGVSWEYYYSPLQNDPGFWFDRQECPQFFCFMFEDDTTTFMLRNDTFTEDDYLVSTTAPIDNYNYQSPDDFGELPNSSIISIDGKLYNIPAPVSEFTSDGWTLVNNGDYSFGLIPGDTTAWDFTLEKGDMEIDICINNPFSEAVAPEYCYLAQIDVYANNDVEIILSRMDNKDIFDFQWSQIKSYMDNYLEFGNYMISTSSQDYYSEVRYDFSPVGHYDSNINNSVAGISYYIDDETGMVNRITFDCWPYSPHSWMDS